MRADRSTRFLWRVQFESIFPIRSIGPPKSMRQSTTVLHLQIRCISFTDVMAYKRQMDWIGK